MVDYEILVRLAPTFFYVESEDGLLLRTRFHLVPSKMKFVCKHIVERVEKN